MLTTNYVLVETAALLLFRMDRRHVSLVDAVSFTVMEVEWVNEMLGLDTAFTKEGFRLFP